MPKKPLKLCPLAQHIVKMLAESKRGGHGPSYAADKAVDLHGKTNAEVLAWVWTHLDLTNQTALAEILSTASMFPPVEVEDVIAAGMVSAAVGALPVLNLQELLS